MIHSSFKRYLLILITFLFITTIFLFDNNNSILISDVFAAEKEEEDLGPDDGYEKRSRYQARAGKNAMSTARVIYPADYMILYEQRDWVTGILKQDKVMYVKIKVTEMSTKEVIDEEDVELEDNGRFTYPVMFAPGVNKIQVGKDTVIYVYYKENEDDEVPKGFQEMLVHQSVADLCEECHDIFAEGRGFPLNTETQTELCENCHRSQIYNRLRKAYKNIHPPVAQGLCTKCHRIHISPIESMLHKPQNELCKECHEAFIAKVKDKEFIHLGNMFDSICTKCHNPHSSNILHLLRDVRKGICKACHTAFSGEKDNVSFKSIHKPVVQSKCHLCHELHAGRNKIFLIKEKPNEACLVCHGAKLSKGHGAKLKACTECHDAHLSEKEGLFTERGIKKCLSCHDKLNYRKDIEAKRNCQKCHTPHSNQNVALAKESCINCHAKKTLPEKHSDLTPSYKVCTKCHQIHGGNEKLLKENTHPLKPLKEKRCKACHTNKDIDTARNACFGCHKGVYKAKHPLTIGIKEKCIGCHKVHGGGDDRMISKIQHKPFKDGECYKCHKSVDESLILSELSKTGELCLRCHTEIDKDKNYFNILKRKKELYEKGKKTKVIEVKKKPEKEEEEEVTVEDLEYELEDPFLASNKRAEIEQLIADMKSGAAAKAEEERKRKEEEERKRKEEEKKRKEEEERKRAVAAGLDPALIEIMGEITLKPYKNTHKPFKQRKCVKCHETHASQFDSLRRKGKQALCYSCHANKEIDESGQAMFSIHQPINDGKCLECHFPHGSGYPRLLHDSQADICFKCHDNFLYNISSMPKAKGGLASGKLSKDELLKYPKYKNIHKPISEQGCMACHNPHASMSKKLLKVEQGKLICYNCHADFTAEDEDGKKRESIHPPVKKEQCTECHEKHAGDRQYLLRKDQGELCTKQCHKLPAEHHKTSVPALESFKAIPADFVVDDRNSLLCTNCHDPHSSPDVALIRGGKKVLCLNCHSSVP